MIEVPTQLKAVLKRLRLSGIVPTLPERIDYVRKRRLSELEMLELVLQDEIDRRDHKSLQRRIDLAGFEEEKTLENFDWDSPVTFDRNAVRDLFSLGFLDRSEDVLFLGPVGVGKSHLAYALGHVACRARKSVRALRSVHLLADLRSARADRTHSRKMAEYLRPDLLIIDDFGLRALDSEQSSDFYELLIERHKRSSTIITSNRDTDEWIPLFDDPLLAQSALDRLVHNSHRIIVEGETYRPKMAPGKADAPSSQPTRRTRRRPKRT